MKYKAVLNNYMLGTYCKGCLKDYIIGRNRIDKNHTEIILEIPLRELNFVKKLLGADTYPKRLEKII